MAGACKGECGLINKVDGTGWVHIKLNRRSGGRGTTFVETCRRRDEVELVTNTESEEAGVSVNKFSSDIFYSRGGEEDFEEEEEEEGEKEEGLKTLAELKTIQWTGTKVRVKAQGKLLGKVMRVFKYGNGWVHATVNMDKEIKELTIEADSSICARSNDLELVDQTLVADRKVPTRKKELTAFTLGVKKVDPEDLE